MQHFVSLQLHDFHAGDNDNVRIIERKKNKTLIFPQGKYLM